MADTKFEFCENCGRKVSLNGQLCSRCGADLSKGDEKILGGIDNINMRGKGGKTSLLFTTNRTIVAETQSLGTELASRAVPSIAGVLLGGALRAHARGKKEQELRATNPEEILSANKKNYAIPYSEVTQLWVKKPEGGRPGMITLTTGQKKIAIKVHSSQPSIELNVLTKLKQGNRLGHKLIIEN